jgi:hypothetical protein
MRPLPEGWSTVVDPKTNMPHYVNGVTGRLQWGFPARQASFAGPKRQDGGDYGDGAEPGPNGFVFFSKEVCPNEDTRKQYDALKLGRRTDRTVRPDGSKPAFQALGGAEDDVALQPLFAMRELIFNASYHGQRHLLPKWSALQEASAQELPHGRRQLECRLHPSANQAYYEQELCASGTMGEIRDFAAMYFKNTLAYAGGECIGSGTKFSTTEPMDLTALEFDHIVQGTKGAYEPSELIRGYPWAVIRDEMRGCRLLTKGAHVRVGAQQSLLGAAYTQELGTIHGPRDAYDPPLPAQRRRRTKGKGTGKPKAKAVPKAKAIAKAIPKASRGILRISGISRMGLVQAWRQGLQFKKFRRQVKRGDVDKAEATAKTMGEYLKVTPPLSAEATQEGVTQEGYEEYEAAVLFSEEVQDEEEGIENEGHEEDEEEEDEDEEDEVEEVDWGASGSLRRRGRLV